MRRNASPSPEGKHIPDRRLGRSWRRRSPSYLYYVITNKLKMYKFWPPHLELLGGNSQQFRAVARFDLNLLGSRRHSSSRPGGLWGRAAFRRFLIQNPEFKTQLQDAWIAGRTGLVKFALDLVNDAQPTGLNLWRCVGVGSPT